MSKVILITGASSGIGKMCAEYLASKGNIVYGTSRKDLNSNESFHILKMDVTNKDSVEEGISRIISEQGRLDVVVNNAGMGYSGALELATDAEVRVQMETNFFGVVNVCTAVLPIFRKQNRGRIINISSVGGVIGLPFQGIYSASKFAVEGYSEALNLELIPFNIDVVIIEPSDFKSSFTANRPIAEATINHPAYKDSYARVNEIITEEELNGSDPIIIAKRIQKIIGQKNPKFRNPVGKWEQVMSIYVKKLIPYSWFKFGIGKYYKI